MNMVRDIVVCGGVLFGKQLSSSACRDRPPVTWPPEQNEEIDQPKEQPWYTNAVADWLAGV